MKTQTAFRLEKTLLEALKEEAKKQNRSLNNYVEFVLSKIIEKKPNLTTQQAIEESTSSEDLIIDKLLQKSEEDITNGNILENDFVMKEMRSKYGI